MPGSRLSAWFDLGGAKAKLVSAFVVNRNANRLIKLPTHPAEQVLAL